jgi:hypothetical protein
MIAFIKSAEPGMPMRSSALMNGDSPTGTCVQGTMHTGPTVPITALEPTKRPAPMMPPRAIIVM